MAIAYTSTPRSPIQQQIKPRQPIIKAKNCVIRVKSRFPTNPRHACCTSPSQCILDVCVHHPANYSLPENINHQLEQALLINKRRSKLYQFLATQLESGIFVQARNLTQTTAELVVLNPIALSKEWEKFVPQKPKPPGYFLRRVLGKQCKKLPSSPYQPSFQINF